MPVFRLTSNCIWNSFRSSNKRHLILTGAAKSGKTTLLSQLFPEGFRTLGSMSLQQCAETNSEWITIDEIGYLEMECLDYCNEIRKLMNQKRLAAAVRNQYLPFLKELCHRDDVFLVDLDSPFGSMGCVIMASGLGTRFGGNKLMTPFKGKPLIQWVLNATEGIFSKRVVVTRHEAVEELCRGQGIEVVSHNLPGLNDTIRLGLEAVAQEAQSCMFCPGDQPLLNSDTIAALGLSGVNDKERIWRAAWENEVGSPVLFPKEIFPELLTLPEGKGGSFVIKKHPEQVGKVLVRDKNELIDIDSPKDLEFLTEGMLSFHS